MKLLYSFNYFFLLLCSVMMTSLCFAPPTNRMTPCRTQDEETICSNLNYIPRLSPNTTSLLLINFQPSTISRVSLSNLTELPLKVLKLKKPKITKATTDVFRDMKHLEELVINELKKTDILHNLFLSLPFTNISALYLYRVKLKKINASVFEGVRNTSLKYLHLNQCLKVFNGENLTSGIWSKLTLLDLSQNKKLTIDSWGNFPILTVLNLTETYIESFPLFYNESHSNYPRLKTLILSLSGDNHLTHDTFKGLPNLNKLELQIKERISMATETIGTHLPKLMSLVVIGISSVKLHLDNKAIKSSSLKNLVIKSASLNSWDDSIDCPHLQRLQLSRFKYKKFLLLTRILSSLQQLKSLRISASNLGTIPAPICNMTNLTKLYLNQNFIYSWRDKNCKAMGNLKEFSLSKNNIKIINQSYFSEALWNNKELKWDLSMNDYSCSCNLVWFRDWLYKNRKRVIHYPKYYRCTLPSKISIKIEKYKVTAEYCSNKSNKFNFIFLGIGLASLSIIMIVCSIVTYINRWSVRYYCYLFWARRRPYTPLNDQIEYIYDAFVCYHNCDTNWVINELIPRIEEEEGFKLCLHDRDFAVGVDIVNNIIESVQTSRKVVLVLSPDFVCSAWCKYEASLAEQRLLEENRDMLIPILLKDIPDDIQTKRLATLLKRKTYLEWTDDNAQGREIFWQKFVDNLRKPSSEVDT